MCFMLKFMDHLKNLKIFKYDFKNYIWYVYGLRDSDKKVSKDGRIFYIGKGTGNRRWVHQSNPIQEKESKKEKIIRLIEQRGGNTKDRPILQRFAEEGEAEMYELALINLTSYSYSLTNIEGKFPFAFDQKLTNIDLRKRREERIKMQESKKRRKDIRIQLAERKLK